MNSLAFFVFALLQFIQGEDFNDVYLFSSQPMIQIAQTELCQNELTVQAFIISQSAAKSNSFFVFSQNCGLIAISISLKNEEDNFTYQKIMTFSQPILAYTYHINTNTFWISDNNQFSIINLADTANPLHINTSTRITNDEPPYDMLVTEDFKLLFMLSKRKIQVYSINSMSEVKNSFIIDTGESTNCFDFQSDSKMLTVGTEKRLILYQIINEKQDQNLTYKFLCKTSESFTVEEVLFYYSSFIIVKSKFLGLWTIDMREFQQSKNCQSIVMQFKQSPVDYNFFLTLIISANKKYVIIEETFRNIQIYEVTEKEGKKDITLFQQIKIESQRYDLSLDYSQQYLLRVDQNNISIFNRILPNYSNRIPNIQNGDQPVLQLEPEMIGDLSRRCIIKNNFLYYSKISDGLFIFKVDSTTGLLKKEVLYKPIPENYEAATPMVTDLTKLIVGATKVNFVDISDLSQPKTLLVTDFGYSTVDSDHIVLNQKEDILFVAAGRAGVIVVDISDFYQPKAIARVYHPIIQFQTSSAENIMLDKDEKFAFVVYRDMGVVIYDIQNLKEIKFHSVHLSMAEDCELSKDNTFMVVAIKQFGVQIVDISDKKNPQKISSIFVEGRTIAVHLIQDDNFVLTSSTLSGQVQLVDIRERKNPKVLQTYEKGYTNSYYLCLNEEKDIAYVALHSGIITLRLYPPNNIQFNLNMYLVKSGLKKFKTKILLDNDYILKVGEEVDFQIIQIYPFKRIRIEKIFYYDNFQKYELPSWAVFNSNTQHLQIKVTNQILDLNEFLEFTSKWFLLQVKEILLKDDFLRVDIGIDSNLSQKIYSFCKNKNLLDAYSYVIVSEQEHILELFNEYTYEQRYHILYILKNKIFYHPISFKAQKSLLFIKDNPPQIKSISNTIKLTLSVSKNDGQLLKILYPSVLSYYTERQDEMRVEGSLESINSIIKGGGFRFANKTQSEQIKLKMTIDDYINNPISVEINAHSSQLIKLNKPVTINPKRTLQEDFNDQYEKGQVQILSSFSYSLNQVIFLDEDNDEITLKAQIKIDGEYQYLPEAFWLSFQDNQKALYGTTKASQYLQIVEIRILASDGYTEVADYLKIEISRVPLWYIVQIIVQVVGPLIGIIGLWRYKSRLYNYFRNNQSIEQSFFVDSDFILQIPLLEDNQKQAKLIWSEYFKKVNKQDILNEIRLIRNVQTNPQKEQKQIENSFHSTPNLLSPIPSHFERYQNMISNYSPMNKFHNNIENASSNFTVEKEGQKQNYNNEQKELSDQIASFTQNNHQEFENSINRNNNNIEESSSNFKELKKDSFHDQEFGKANSPKRLVRKLKKSIIQNRSMVERASIVANLSHFKWNGDINEAGVIENVKQFCLNNPKLKLKPNTISELSKEKSKLNRCIIGYCALSISQLEKVSMTLIQYLKLSAIKSGFLEKQWYRFYVKIIPQPDNVYLDPFPIVQCNETKILYYINNLESQIKHEDDNYKQFNFKYMIPLINQLLTAATFGISNDKHLLLDNIRGECLQLFPHNILCIKAYKPVYQKSILRCGKIVEVFKEKEFSLNTTIPSWINKIDIVNGVIILKGKIDPQDIGTHILRIYDTRHFIVKEMRIKISKNTPKEPDEESISQSSNIPIEFQSEELQLYKHYFKEIQ